MIAKKRCPFLGVVFHLMDFYVFTLLTKKGIYIAWKTDFRSEARRAKCHIPFDSVRRDQKMSVCVCVCVCVFLCVCVCVCVTKFCCSVFSATSGPNWTIDTPNERYN